MATPTPNDTLKSQLQAANERYAVKASPTTVTDSRGNPMGVIDSEFLANTPLPDIKEMSGGLVSPVSQPSAVEQGVNAMKNWRNTGIDESGNIMTPEQRVARHKAELDIAAGNKPNQVAVRDNGFTMPNEPDRTLATRPNGTITAEPPLATVESTAQEALSKGGGLGALLKGGARNVLPIIGDIWQGYDSYKQGGDDVGRGITAGVGSLAGRLGLGAVGSFAGPVGTFGGEVAGSFGGRELGQQIYDRYFKHTKPVAPNVAPQAPVATTPAPTVQQQAQDQLKEPDNIVRYNNFRQGVQNDRAMEAALGRAHTSDPVYNLQTAQLLADTAKAKAGGDSEKTANYLPPQDPRYPSDTVAMAQQILRNPNMTQAEGISNMMATTPENQLSRQAINDEARAEKIAGLQAGVEAKGDRTALAEKALEVKQQVADSKDLQRSAGVRAPEAMYTQAQKHYDTLADKVAQGLIDADSPAFKAAADRLKRTHQDFQRARVKVGSITQEEADQATGDLEDELTASAVPPPVTVKTADEVKKLAPGTRFTFNGKTGTVPNTNK